MKTVTSAIACILLIIVIFQFKEILEKKSTIEQIDKAFHQQSKLKKLKKNGKN